ncbi:hypothetical protein D7V90_20620 [bacterium 1xD42-87]|nr:hypothetical protein D7V90_20620 [bacterium 1xD42-87]
MIIKKYCYECSKCNQLYFFEAGKEFSDICPICNVKMDLEGTYNCDTDLAEKAKNTPPYDPTKDPNSPYYIPIIKCPTCQSTNAQKIGTGERVVSVATMGIFSKKINKSFKCKSCGYTW